MHNLPPVERIKLAFEAFERARERAGTMTARNVTSYTDMTLDGDDAVIQTWVTGRHIGDSRMSLQIAFDETLRQAVNGEEMTIYQAEMATALLITMRVEPKADFLKNNL